MYVKTIDYRSPNAAADFVSSIRETGFAVLCNHPISIDLLNSVYSEWQHFFSHDEKYEYLFDPKTTKQGGYFPFKSENSRSYDVGDLKEFYHFWDELDLPEGMSGSTTQLQHDMLFMAEEILRWMHDALPDHIASELSMPFDKMIEGSNTSLLRVIHYPPIADDEDERAIRSAEHEDVNIITLLPAATQAGLQVKDTNGQWHEVACDPGTIVCNVADMLQLASQGFYKSTTHRVVNPVGSEARKSRFSMPMFVHARPEVRLSADHTAHSFLEKRLGEIGLKTHNQAA